EWSHAMIKVTDLSKSYRLGGQQGQYRTIREVISNRVSSAVRGLRHRIIRDDTMAPRSTPQEKVDALKDVSFEVAEGEAVGVIGHNGAGKSTLLKILGRITEPSSGRAELRGRIGGLLEVGTGFHPELTGRENIFLNGAILGMTRQEITKQFDRIVDFAEV